MRANRPSNRSTDQQIDRSSDCPVDVVVVRSLTLTSKIYFQFSVFGFQFRYDWMCSRAAQELEMGAGAPRFNWATFRLDLRIFYLSLYNSEFSPWSRQLPDRPRRLSLSLIFSLYVSFSICISFALYISFSIYICYIFAELPSTVCRQLRKRNQAQNMRSMIKYCRAT